MKSNKNGSFFDFLVLRPDNFPKELLGGLFLFPPSQYSLDVFSFILLIIIWIMRFQILEENNGL